MRLRERQDTLSCKRSPEHNGEILWTGRERAGCLERFLILQKRVLTRCERSGPLALLRILRNLQEKYLEMSGTGTVWGGAAILESPTLCWDRRLSYKEMTCKGGCTTPC